MEAIAKNVYIEDQYVGVTLAAIVQPRGLIQIDAPPAPEDSRAWRGALMGLGSGPDRILINLDAHPDRTLGARAMDCTVIAHEKTAATFRNRPTTFKAQGEDTGANWESIPGLGSVRWAPPEISFGETMTLHWGENPIFLEHHPGPSAGSIWVVLPDEKIVFVGDTVSKNQAPFLANADLPAWLGALKLLQEPEYKGFTIVSGRGGVVAQQTVRNQAGLIKYIYDRLEKLANRGAFPDATDKVADSLLNRFKAPAARQKQFTQRLRYGLYHYYVRRYHRPGNSLEDQ